MNKPDFELVSTRWFQGTLTKIYFGIWYYNYHPESLGRACQALGFLRTHHDMRGGYFLQKWMGSSIYAI